MPMRGKVSFRSLRPRGGGFLSVPSAHAGEGFFPFPPPTRGRVSFRSLRPRGGGFLSVPSPLAGEGEGEGPMTRDFARQLRRDMTDAERLLWKHLRAHRFV